MISSDGSFCLPVCVLQCVFIESSVSHISLKEWNNLSGTVFPRVLYLKYLFCLYFLDYVRVLKHSAPDLQRVCVWVCVCVSDFVCFAYAYSSDP